MSSDVENVVVRLDQCPEEELTWLWPRRIAAGKLTLIDGDPQAGQVAVDARSGSPPLQGHSLSRRPPSHRSRDGSARGHELQLSNESRFISLPCSGDTIRGFANVKVLIIDEAARVPDDLYRTVRPMLAVSGGRLLCLSTPYGKRGFFYDAWAHGGPEWMRVEVPAAQVPRIAPEFLKEERRNLGESWYRQEYCCSFEVLEGLVYPDFAKYAAGEQGAAALWHGLPTSETVPLALAWLCGLAAQLTSFYISLRLFSPFVCLLQPAVLC
jgi:hypothetical protein